MIVKTSQLSNIVGEVMIVSLLYKDKNIQLSNIVGEVMIVSLLYT